MIDLSQLSFNEKAAMEELRKRVENDLTKSMLEDPSLFHRFLVARDMDVDKAEKMLRKHITWRKSFQVETILEDFTPKPFFFKYGKSSQLGFDKKGNFVNYFPLGKLESKDILKCTTLNDYVKAWIWHIEEVGVRAKEVMIKHPGCYAQLILIVDLDKLTIGNAASKETADICFRMLHLLQDNYPECLRSMYVINAPVYYVIPYNIAKSILSKAMIQKLNFFGYSGWKESLLKIIDADVLPAFLGGNRTDPDGNPLCTTFVNHYGRIPEIYHMPKEERYFSHSSQINQIVVPQREKAEISVDVTEIASLITWRFFIKRKDIRFGLFYRLSDKELEEVLPVQQYDTAYGIESGFYKSQSTGKYIIVFDNSYSWMNSKEIVYSITVEKSRL